MDHCQECTDIELCPTCENSWQEAEKDREFDERVALGFV